MDQVNVEAQERRFAQLRAQAAAMGGPEKLEARRAQGVMNVRERVDFLIDEGSWRESGLFAKAIEPELQDVTPADGKVVGFGKIDGRKVAIIAYDFTVKGSSSSAINSRKMNHMKKAGVRRGMPVVFLGESTGVRMPWVMGGSGMSLMQDKTRFLRRREVPWVAAVLGSCFGSAAWHACASDFAVMRKGATFAVSSPLLVGMATAQTIDSEELGGWRLHSEVTGFADAVAETDEEALSLLQRFLSYLPSHAHQLPPEAPVPADSGSRVDEILSVLPDRPSEVYDVRRVIAIVFDTQSFFELKPRFGRSLVTGLCRLNGRVVGVIANNPRHLGGAIDADACSKATSFIVLCDSFNIPIVHLVDQPGFLIGAAAERRGIAGKVINWMNALSLATVPMVAIILRKSYGQAFVNMGAAGMGDEVAAWWSADVSFMDPRSAVRVVYGISETDDPELFQEKLLEMQRANSAYDLGAGYGVQEVTDPRATRDYLVATLEYAALDSSGGIGAHHLANWPTSYV